MNFMNLLRLNLQFFSQDDTGGSNPSDDKQDDKQDDNQDDNPDDQTDKDKRKQQDDKKKNEPVFTQAQVDNIVKDRVSRAEKDKEAAVKEAEKLAKMTADQKREYEYEKLQRENEELKKAQNQYELGKEATKILSESGITATDEILEMVVREDAEKTSEAVKAFSDLVEKVSDERMKEKLKGKPPKKPASGGGAVTKESIFNIKDSAERIKAIQDNPHLFKN